MRSVSLTSVLAVALSDALLPALSISQLPTGNGESRPSSALERPASSSAVCSPCDGDIRPLIKASILSAELPEVWAVELHAPEPVPAPGADTASVTEAAAFADDADGAEDADEGNEPACGTEPAADAAAAELLLGCSAAVELVPDDAAGLRPAKSGAGAAAGAAAAAAAASFF